MIIIFVVALIVVGPDKLPELARSIAKGVMEMKRTLNEVKGNFSEEGELIDSVQKDLRKTALDLHDKVNPAHHLRDLTSPTTMQPGEVAQHPNAMETQATPGEANAAPELSQNTTASDTAPPSPPPFTPLNGQESEAAQTENSASPQPPA